MEDIVERQGKVAAVFATMNRSATARACVMALAAQTLPPSLVVVADNVSEDDTAPSLLSLRDLPFRFILHRMPENLGNAGGIQEAMKIAFSHDMDAVWILDDDSWPRTEALSELLSIPIIESEVRHSIQIDPKSGDLTWPMQVYDDCNGWRTIDSLTEIVGVSSITTRNNWTGSLVPKQVWKIVGPVCGDLFIRGEDEEYPWRFQLAGITQRVMMNSILDHPGPRELRRFRFFGRTIYFEPGLVDWKLYYKVRNMIWLQRKKRGLIAASLLWLAYTGIVIRSDGLAKLPLMIRSALDGFSGRLGRWKHHPL